MNAREAADLIRAAVTAPGGTWADLGAGTGAFTLALAELLGSAGQVIAVDRDPASVVALRGLAARERAPILAVHADFAEPFELPPLDGALFANALHYVAPHEQAGVLRAIVQSLKPSGRIALVEYEGRRANQWVPYPIPFARFRQLAKQAGLAAPREIGTRPSTYGGTMYAAWAPRA